MVFLSPICFDGKKLSHHYVNKQVLLSFDSRPSVEVWSSGLFRVKFILVNAEFASLSKRHFANCALVGL